MSLALNLLMALFGGRRVTPQQRVLVVSWITGCEAAGLRKKGWTRQGLLLTLSQEKEAWDELGG